MYLLSFAFELVYCKPCTLHFPVFLSACSVSTDHVIDDNVTIYTQLSKLLRSTLVVSRTMPAYHLLRRHRDSVVLIHRYES